MGGDTPATTTSESLIAQQIQSLFSVALHRWQATGVDIFTLGSVRIQIANLSGSVDRAIGDTASLDDVGCGHEQDRVKADVPTSGVLQSPESTSGIDWLGASDALFASAVQGRSSKARPGWHCPR